MKFKNISNEIYAPRFLISLGHFFHAKPFDLDPASSAYANSLHGVNIATKFYDEWENGLKQKWEGNVWLFPPFSEGLQDTKKWFEAAEWRYLAGEIKSCILLIKYEQNEELMSQIFRHPHCFVKEKLSFSTPSGKSKVFPYNFFILVYL